MLVYERGHLGAEALVRSDAVKASLAPTINRKLQEHDCACAEAGKSPEYD
jgi:hypothetical protein